MATVSPISHIDHTQTKHATGLDWPRIAYLTQLSRAIDDLEETELLKNREVLYQFSARGHDMAQIILASMLDHPGDAASGYYRSRPFLLALDLDLGVCGGQPERFQVAAVEVEVGEGVAGAVLQLVLPFDAAGIDALEAVSRVLAKAIPLERQAFSLDSEKGEVQSIKRESLLSGYYRAALRREDMVVMQGGSSEPPSPARSPQGEISSGSPTTPSDLAHPATALG